MSVARRALTVRLPLLAAMVLAAAWVAVAAADSPWSGDVACARAMLSDRRVLALVPPLLSLPVGPPSLVASPPPLPVGPLPLVPPLVLA